MNKDYQGTNNIELRAKELLASLRGSCPNMVWDEVSIELEARRNKANEKWLNKINTPKLAVFVTIAAVVVTLVSWKFVFAKKNTVIPDRTVYQSAPPSQNISANTPPLTTAPVAVSQSKKDSIVPVVPTQVNTTDNRAANTPVTQLAINTNANKTTVPLKPIVQQHATMPSQKDSTHGNSEKTGEASLNNEQTDTTFTMHRSGMAPVSSGGGTAVQDTASN